MDFKFYAKKFSSVGEVVGLEYPLARVSGLPDANINEVLIFENGLQGVVYDLRRDFINVLLLSNDHLPLGSKVAKKGQELQIPVSLDAVGSVIDSLGRTLGGVANKAGDFYLLDKEPLGVMHREIITEQLHTGFSSIDSLFPIGLGQRELIVGDKRTGKSTFLRSVIRCQVQTSSISIYCLIGAKKTEVENLLTYLKYFKVRNILVIASFAGGPQALNYLAPYTAMAYAEYFRDQGRNVLVVLDDLSIHAKFCREISLIAKKIPTRDSYPADIFYTHSKLLERAGNFKVGDSTVSITCLPVAQTKDDNVTDYIVSNLIGITDGHLLFDEVEFSKGRTPALNFQLSVTRVGRQVQTRLAQEIARKTLSFMTSKYLSSLSISHFGSELNEDILEVLHKGDLIFAFLTQEEIEEVPEICQRVFFGALMADFFKLESPIKMPFYRKNLVNNFNNNKKATELVNSLAGAPTFNDLVKKLDLYKAEFLSICKSFGK